MKIYVGKPPKPGGPEKFTMGESVFRPTDEQIKKLGLERPLRRLTKLLIEKYPDAGAIGLEVGGITFNWLLDPEK